MPIVQHDPKTAQLATSEDYRKARLEVEEMPIQCIDGTVFDADTDSMNRLKAAVDYWNDLGKSDIDWRAKNQTKKLNKTQLLSYSDEIQKKKAMRIFDIDNDIQQMKSNPNITLRDLENWKLTYSL